MELNTAGQKEHALLLEIRCYCYCYHALLLLMNERCRANI